MMSRRGTTKRGGLPKKRTRNPCPVCGRITGHDAERHAKRR